LHLIVAVAVVIAARIGVQARLGWWLSVFAAGSLSALVITTVLALARHPEPWRTISSFFMLPLYAGWRIVVFAGTILTLRDTTWRRTARTGSQVGRAVPLTGTRG
jgi:hypothetical protein